MSRPDTLRPGYFRVFQGTDGSFVDMHETHGKLESRQNIPIALFPAARGERVRRAENILEIAVLLTDVLHHFSRTEILNNTFRGKMG